jgi:sensor histidine kinase regulating citrate/malate metabolism
MSRIYDALIKAGKKPESRLLSSQSQKEHEAGSLGFWWRGVSIDRKIVGTVATVMLISGLLVVAIVHQLMGGALRAQIDRRGFIVATSLSDSAAGYVAGKNALELHALVTKFARLDGVAYAFIEDHNGQVLAHSLRPFPAGFQKTLTTDERKQANKRVINTEGKTVYEFRAPILEGQRGSAHLGLWEESVKTQVNGALLPVIWAIVVLFLVSLILAVLLLQMIARPISTLTDPAKNVRATHLESPIENRAIG